MVVGILQGHYIEPSSSQAAFDLMPVDLPLRTEDGEEGEEERFESLLPRCSIRRARSAHGKKTDRGPMG